MSLISCNECGKEISSKAAACPGCGAPLQNISRDKELLFLSIGIVLSVFAAWIPFFFAPRFIEVLKFYGADLSYLSLIAIQYYPVTCAIPALVVLAWFYWPNKAKRSLVCRNIGIISLVIVAPILILAMYWPLFGLGAVLGDFIWP
jgi:hypothetical protein